MMYGERTQKVIRLQDYPGGVAAGIRSVLRNGRYEIVSAGPNSEFGFIGSDPWGTNVSTGLVVPPIPSDEIGGARYLFLLARVSFGTGEQSSDRLGARLVGIRQYAELVARLPGRTAPLSTTAGPPTGSTVTFRREITSPLWHPFDGDISWHVMLLNKGFRDTRNPDNTDGFIFQDSRSPALLYNTASPYLPPNNGVPWGLPLAASLGNMHDLRYRWRTERSECVLDIPIPAPCDVALFASVRQPDPLLNPQFGDISSPGISFLSPEDQFVAAFPSAQYGTIAGALVFEDNLGEDVP